MQFESANFPAGRTSEDRVYVSDRLVVLADGAGGMSGGAEAAQAVVDYFVGLGKIEERYLCIHFHQLDQKISALRGAGEATAVVVCFEDDRLFGASVGDSEAWFVPFSGEMIDLTERQRRKPLMGSGEAFTVPFTCELRAGVLVVGSDGLFKYARRQALLERLRGDQFVGIAEELADLARLPSGSLQDDLSAAVVRRATPG